MPWGGANAGGGRRKWAGGSGGQRSNYNNRNHNHSRWSTNMMDGGSGTSSISTAAGDFNVGQRLSYATPSTSTVTSTSNDSDDWGSFADLPPREPYVYNPAWAKEFPHLVGVPISAEKNKETTEMWKDGWTHSDDEEEEMLSGGSNAMNRKMPSATLTARRPNYPHLKPIRLAVGELSDPLADRSFWSGKVPDKFETGPESEKRLATAVRKLAGEEEEEEGENVNIPYSVDLDQYKPKFTKKGGIDYQSFIPPLPTQEDILKAKEVAAAAVEEDTEKVEEEIVQEGKEDEFDNQAKVEVVAAEEVTLPDTSVDSVTDPSIEEEDTYYQNPILDSDSDMPPTPTSVIMDEHCPPLNPILPLKARLIGFLDGGFALIRFCDIATKAQFQNLLDTIWDYFGSMDEDELVLPENQIVEDIVVLGKLPDQSQGAGNICRVRILKNYPDTKSALCKDMDTWVIATLPYQNIYRMPPTMMETPFLMHRCRMKGLEFWSEGQVMKEIASLVPSISDDVVITSYETDIDGVPLVEVKVQMAKGGVSGGRSRGIGPGIGSPEDTAMLADVVARTITGFTRIPRQFVKGTLMNRGHVSNVEKDGRAWISLHSALASRLVTIGEKPRRIMTSREFNPTIGTKQEMTDFEYAYFVLGQSRFLAHFLDDRGHFRVEIDEYKMGDKEVKVHYLDFGNTEVIPVEDIYPTDLFDPLLNKIVPQVIQGCLNGIQEIRNVDEFFDHISIKRWQKITVAGFQQPNATLLLDVHIQTETPPTEGTGTVDPVGQDKVPEYIYVNQYLVDKGLATPRPEGVIQFRLVGGDQSDTRSVLQMRELSLKDSTAKQRARCLKASERNRYLNSCRIEEEDDGRYTCITEEKPVKKVRKPVVRRSTLDPMQESEQEEG